MAGNLNFDDIGKMVALVGKKTLTASARLSRRGVLLPPKSHQRTQTNPPREQPREQRAVDQQSAMRGGWSRNLNPTDVA